MSRNAYSEFGRRVPNLKLFRIDNGVLHCQHFTFYNDLKLTLEYQIGLTLTYGSHHVVSLDKIK